MILALLLAAAPSANSLEAAFAAAHQDYAATLTDQFAETTFDPDLIGQPFKVISPLGDGNGYSNSSGAYYTFKEGKLRLIFIAHEGYAGPGIQGPKYVIGKVNTVRKTKRSYVGSNAFGVKPNVRVSSIQENNLAMLERPPGEKNPYSSSSEGYMSPTIAAVIASMPKLSYWTEFTLPGPGARKLARDSALVIEGRIAALADGKPNSCKALHISPTVETPVEVYGSQCLVGAKVTRIAYIRRSTGEVLKEWTTPVAQAQVTP